ncbi:MAG: biotin/lipoyl-binding protein [Cyanobacteriota bacterium]
MKIKPIFVVSLIGLIAGIVFTIAQAQKDPAVKPLRVPALKPYKSSIAGMGIIESYQENIDINPYWAGKIIKIYVKEGQVVKKGDPIYELDTRHLNAQLNSLTEQAKAKNAQLQTMKKQPRPEDIPPLEALVAQSEANYNNIKSQYNKLSSVSDPRAVSLDSIDKIKYELEAAKATMDKARADLKRLKAGAWSYEINQVKTEYDASVASIEEVKVLLDEAIVRAPEDGEILKVYNHVGEYVSTVSNDPPVLFGTTAKMQVRVDIDEVNASNVRPGMKAIASLKGDSGKKFRLNFLRIQPYMVPKKNLSGLATERVDVRVLQVIYEFEPPEFPVYVGQQVDVFLDDNKS